MTNDVANDEKQHEVLVLIKSLSLIHSAMSVKPKPFSKHHSCEVSKKLPLVQTT